MNIDGAREAIAATYEAADGDSNDTEIQALQECRDLLEQYITEQDYEGRRLSSRAEPLADGHILGLREQFATAEADGAKITYCHGFGFGASMISIEVDLPDGTYVAEAMPLGDLLLEWTKQILNENGVK